MNSCLWIILLLFFCNGNGCGYSNGSNGNNGNSRNNGISRINDSCDNEFDTNSDYVFNSTREIIGGGVESRQVPPPPPRPRSPYEDCGCD